MNILLVDDHALFRAGLRLLLRAIRPDALIFEASTLADALLLCEGASEPQVCLLDLSLRGESGFDALTCLKQKLPKAPIVVVSGDEDLRTIRLCMDAGAMSYIPKSLPPEVLTEALEKVLHGQLFLPQQVIDAERRAEPSPHFTRRQLEVLSFLNQGWATKAISREMQLSEHTVKEHIAMIFQALGAHNRTEAVIRAAALSIRAPIQSALSRAP
jgi:DNA-binding NarL/FixJ family response regulator